MFNFFNKTEEIISPVTPGFEEKERQTPLVGKILVVIMFVSGMYFGETSVGDIAGIPDQPVPLSYCSSGYHFRDDLKKSYSRKYDYYNYTNYSSDSYDYYSDGSKCIFNVFEKESEIPEIFQTREPTKKELDQINKLLSDTDRLIYTTQEKTKTIEKQYGISLQERGIQVSNPIFSTGSAQQEILNQRRIESDFNSQKNNLLKQKSSTEDKLKILDEQLRKAYKPVFEKQNIATKQYEFKVFLLQFILIIPLFLISFFWYLRLHRQNSPYTIILIATTAVTSVLALQIILVWFWGLFLARIIEVLMIWIASFALLSGLIFYGGMILSFVVFGGALYWLQKKVYDPRRVALRRFRENQCPHCQASLNLADNYCPVCSQQLKKLCPKCQQLTFIDLLCCPHCGEKTSQV